MKVLPEGARVMKVGSPVSSLVGQLQCRRNRSGRPGVRRTNIQLTLPYLQVGCHKKVVNLTHACLNAIQNQWDLTHMRKDLYLLPYQSKNASPPPEL
jgi:hypothetical protein